MSKSTGKIMTVQELQKEGYNPMDYRYLFLNSHYRRGLDFTLEALGAAKNAYEKLNRLLIEMPEGGEISPEWKQKFEEKVSDDLAMPEALAVMWNMLKDENLTPADKRATFENMNQVLGLKLDKKTEEVVPEDILKLFDEREKARAEKNWVESDRLRDLLKGKGYLIEDNKEGSKIKKL